MGFCVNRKVDTHNEGGYNKNILTNHRQGVVSMVKRLNVLILCTLILLVFAGCKKSPQEKPLEPYEQKKEEVRKIVQEKSTDDAVEEILKGMTLEEKVWQMMFVQPEDVTKVSEVFSAGETTKKAIEKYPVGGIIYFAPNFKDRNQTLEMISNTQSYSKIPLFISVDEEGGRVSRLGSNPQMGTTKHPSMAEIGESEDPEKAYALGKTLATELKELGFNVGFAPVADVLINENNTEIGDRSFGYDVENVSLMVKNVVKGLEENGISATLKHFPGAGAVEGDSHDKPTENTRTIEEIRQNEFKPFKAGIDAGVDFVMVSHMKLMNATEKQLPCSLSEEVIRKMLIEELGFSGIVITDSLKMNAVSGIYTPSEIGVMSINAGVDMILMPSDLEKTHGAIVKAVEDGEITQERINESVRKILKLKIEKGLWK